LLVIINCNALAIASVPYFRKTSGILSGSGDPYI